MTQSLKIQFITSCAVCFVLGSLAGRVLWGEKATTAARGDLRDQSPRVTSARHGSEPAVVSKPVPSNEVQQILAQPKAVNRRSAFYQILAQLTPDNWTTTYDAFMARRKQGFQDEEEWGMFLNAVGAIDGERVMTRLFKDFKASLDANPAGDFHYILRTWVPADKASADAWYQSLPKCKFRDGLYSGYLGGLAELDLGQAIAEVGKVEPKSRHYFLYDLIPRIFQQGGVKAGQEWLDQTLSMVEQSPSSDGGYLTQVFKEVASRMNSANKASETPEKTVEWLEKYLDKPYFYEGTWTSAARSWVTKAPETAMTKFESLYTDHPSKSVAALSSGMTHWASLQKGDAERWLAAQQDKPFYDQVAVPYIKWLQTSAPHETTKWIDSLADPEQRERLR